MPSDFGVEPLIGPGGLALRLAGVRHRYRSGATPALDGVDLEVARGEVVALVGSNGAGKSTLLRVLAGELRPESGEVLLPERRSAGRLSTGWAPDEGAHFEALTGERNATFFARAAGLARSAAAHAVREHALALGLREQDARRPVAHLSFGQRRKLLLVEAMAHRPDLLLLDEPTAGLDQEAREALARLLRAGAAEGRSAVVASHDLPLLPELADRVVFVHRGRLAGGGRPTELLAGAGGATRLEITLESACATLPASLGAGVRLVDDGEPLVLESTRGQAALPGVTAALIAAGARIRSVVVREPGLAEAFRRATGEDLEP